MTVLGKIRGIFYACDSAKTYVTHVLMNEDTAQVLLQELEEDGLIERGAVQRLWGAECYGMKIALDPNVPDGEVKAASVVTTT